MDMWAVGAIAYELLLNEPLYTVWSQWEGEGEREYRVSESNHVIWF